MKKLKMEGYHFLVRETAKIQNFERKQCLDPCFQMFSGGGGGNDKKGQNLYNPGTLKKMSGSRGEYRICYTTLDGIQVDWDPGPPWPSAFSTIG
jgi:hypothetical protein